MTSATFSLAQLGWRASFAQQLTLADLESGLPARISNVQRSTLTALSDIGELDLTFPRNLAGVVTVGDWVLIERAMARVIRLLDRHTVIARIGAGAEHRLQPIAANLDTLFIVSSCNDDFNLSRLERYLALALAAHIEPVIVLTKSDLCGDVSRYIEATAALAPHSEVICLNAASSEAAHGLARWTSSGNTIALVGSSGVGKSTLINSLASASLQITGGVREHDQRGRHTTTSRQMISLPSGAWVIDTPGMRELKLGAVETGVEAVFDDVETLARSCRYRDCTHQNDEGCAVRSAIASGTLDARRLRSYLKLQREAENASRTLRERRERERHFGKLYKGVQAQRRRDKGNF